MKSINFKISITILSALSLFLLINSRANASLPYQNFPTNFDGNCGSGQQKVNDPQNGETRCVNIADLQNYIKANSSEPTKKTESSPSECANSNEILMTLPGTNQFRCVSSNIYPNIPQELRTKQARELQSGNLLIPKAERLNVSGYKIQIPIPCQPLAGGQCASADTPAGYIARIYQFGLMIVGFAAFTMIVYGGVLYVFAAGDITKTSDAKDVIQNAIYGLILFLGAYLILYTINPNLVNLRNPELEFLQIENLAPPPEPQPDLLANKGGLGSGGIGNDDPLCDLAVNGSVGISINAGTAGSGSGSAGVIGCVKCAANAALGSDLKCACGSGYVEYSSTCISQNSCKDVGGKIEGSSCKVAKKDDSGCIAKGGTCQEKSTCKTGKTQEDLCLSNPSTTYLCCLP